MKMNRWGIACVLAAYAFVLGAAIPFFHAAAAPGKAVIQLEELEWDWVPLPAAQHRKTGPVPQAVDKIDKSISKDSIGYVTYFINFDAKAVVTCNCAYSPSSASMDFGFISSNGKFYYIHVKGGSINQTIGINQAGSYAMAIRNRSSQTVRVVGFLEF